ncbi:MAG: alpha/beta fold hydrolase [Clostridia bacterium]|nr:alpha/beta fold hydrolase [Clostridia bacterium]
MIFNEKNLTEAIWEGFKKYEFEIFGTKAIIAAPNEPDPNNKWVFRAEFFGAFPMADLALLEKGYYVVYLNKFAMYGHDSAIDEMHRFKNYLCEKYGFYNKTVMFGFSRGGMYTVNYAAKYPEDISAIYLDAPVLNALSWPGGKGRSPLYPNEWEEYLNIYGITAEEALSVRNQPIDNTERLIELKIPAIVVVGCADTVVPYEENAKIFIKKYRDSGAVIEVYEKPECDHHPHSLADPTPIVDFVLRYNK